MLGSTLLRNRCRRNRIRRDRCRRVKCRRDRCRRVKCRRDRCRRNKCRRNRCRKNSQRKRAKARRLRGEQIWSSVKGFAHRIATESWLTVDKVVFLHGFVRVPWSYRDCFSFGCLARFLGTIWCFYRQKMSPHKKEKDNGRLVCQREVKAEGSLHSNSLVVTGRSEHGWIYRIPCHGVHTPFRVSLEGFNQYAVFFVPYVHFRIWIEIWSQYLPVQNKVRC